MKDFIWSYWSFETIIALASMTYFVNLDAYDLNLGDKIVFNDFMIYARVFHCTYDRSWLLFKSMILYLCSWPYLKVILYVYIVALVCFIIEIVRVLFNHKKNFYIGEFQSMLRMHMILGFDKRHSPGKFTQKPIAFGPISWQTSFIMCLHMISALSKNVPSLPARALRSWNKLSAIRSTSLFHLSTSCSNTTCRSQDDMMLNLIILRYKIWKYTFLMTS